MDSGAHVSEEVRALIEELKAEQRAATDVRNWRIAVPIGLLFVLIVAFAVLGLLHIETLGEQAAEMSSVGLSSSAPF